MRAPRPLPLLVCFWVVAIVLGGCSTDLDFLAKTGGSGVDAGDPDAAPPSPPSNSPGHTPRDPDPVPRDPEPSGPPVMTLLHAIIDAPRLFFCFAAEGGIVGQPVPAGGLEFLESMVLERVDGFDLAADLLQPVVIAASAASVAERDCEQLVQLAAEYAASQVPPGDAGAAGDASMDAAPPLAPPSPAAVRAQALAGIPAGTLTEPRSFLLAASGCLGGRVYTDAAERRVCGSSYAPNQPTARAQLVTLSRITRYDVLALQFFNASVALELGELRSVPPAGSDTHTLFIADDVVPGQIAPVPPAATRPVAGLGMPLTAVQLAVYESDQSAATFEAAWSEAMLRSGVKELENGRSYTVVYAGPRPSAPPGAWWNPPGFALLENAPLQ